MKAIVLNDMTDEVGVHVIPQDIVEDRENFLTRAENYLAEELGYSLDNISYMLSNGGNGSDEIKVYDDNGDIITTL